MARNDSKPVEAVGLKALSGDLWVEPCTALIRSWQRILRLEDWDIEFRVLRARDHEPGERCFASITGDQLSKTARLDFVNPIDWDGDKRTAWEIDETIGHELTHLYFRQAGIDLDDDNKEEIVVRGFMRAAMSLRYGEHQGGNDAMLKRLASALERLN